MSATLPHPEAPSPLVSVVIPTFNRMTTLPAAIGSVQRQSYRNIELIIVDDLSNDGTRAFLEDLDLPFPLITRFHTDRRGGAAARNTGIAVANGAYIAFLDSDDEWHEDKLTLQIARLRDLGPDYEGCFCGWRSVDAAGRPFYVRASKLEGDVYGALLQDNFIGTTSSFLAARSRILEVGGFDSSLRACQDWDLYLRLAKVTRFANADACLLDYLDDRSERISTNPAARMQGHLRVYAKHRRTFVRSTPRAASELRLLVADCLTRLGRTRRARALTLGASRLTPFSPAVPRQLYRIWRRYGAAGQAKAAGRQPPLALEPTARPLASRHASEPVAGGNGTLPSERDRRAPLPFGKGATPSP